MVGPITKKRREFKKISFGKGLGEVGSGLKTFAGGVRPTSLRLTIGGEPTFATFEKKKKKKGKGKKLTKKEKALLKKLLARKR